MQTKNEEKSSRHWPMLVFADVENVVAALHDIEDRDRPALRARLKQFARRGVPSSANVGSGRAVTYSFGDLFQVVLAVEFVQLALTTDRAAALVAYWWPRGLYKVAWLSYRAMADPVVIVLRLEGYDGLEKTSSIEAFQARSVAEHPDAAPTVAFGRFSQAFGVDGVYPVGNPDVFKRVSLVNTTGLVFRLRRILNEHELVNYDVFHEACYSEPVALDENIVRL